LAFAKGQVFHEGPAVANSSLPAGRGWVPPMDKWLCWGSMGVAGLMLLLFILDIIFAIPFGRIHIVIDVFGILASGVIIFLALDAARELR
jgi:hypothetical protein